MSKLLKILISICLLTALLSSPISADPIIRWPNHGANLVKGIYDIKKGNYWPPGTFPHPRIKEWPGIMFGPIVVLQCEGRLVLMDTKTGESRDLGPGFDPWISPDGTKMVYSCYDQKNTNDSSAIPADSTLFIMDLLTGTKMPIVKNAVRACWQGKTMIFVRRQKVAGNIFRDEIWATNSSPASARRLWASPTTDYYVGYPCLTWDSKKVIIDGRWIVDVATGKVKEFNPPRHHLTPIFGLFIHLKGNRGEDLILIQSSDYLLVLLNLEGKIIKKIHRAR